MKLRIDKARTGVLFVLAIILAATPVIAADGSKTTPAATAAVETSSPAVAGTDDSRSDRAEMGRIEIPRIGLSAAIHYGEDDATLDRAVGLLDGTPRPGEGGNTALAAHRDTFFRPLENIEVEDRITIVVPPHTYEYRVQSLQVVEPTEVGVLDSSGVEELTLVTCYPFRWVGPAPNRFIVKAVRVR